MIPDKIHWFMGYNNLALILEQERRHWLLKTDKKKQLQDKKTGDMFQGQIDNLGSDIIIETEKLPNKNDIVQNMSFVHPNINKILSIEYSAFTYSSMVNGFMFARIISTNFQRKTGNDISFNHYKLILKNCEECIIPFGSNSESSDVFSYKWIKTTTPPSLSILGEDGKYSIEQEISFGDNITNVVFYYPITDTLQPLDIFPLGSDSYMTEAVNDNGFIGYPLFWFTCDQSNVGPTIYIGNNMNDRHETLIHVSNEGNSSKYHAKLYIGLDGNNNATPDGSNTSNYQIRCNPKTGFNFDSENVDNCDIPIDPSSISFRNMITSQDYFVDIKCSDSDIITMTESAGWTVLDSNTAIISMDIFDRNCLSLHSLPLKSIFDIHFDENIPFDNITSDTGYSGIRMSSANRYSDIYPEYPYDLNKWDGLPSWINETEEYKSSQHMCIYTIHNTANYSSSIPDSRQTAAILLDTGLPKTSEANDSLDNDERGRAYLLSNDKAIYENNSITDFTKPARTIARICDVPTSVMQLSGIHDIAPTSIVDKKYVRSEASFSEKDKDRLYNTLGNRWVKPTDLDYNGNPLTNEIGQDNRYVFNNFNILEKVDLIGHNDYRRYENINPVVDPENVVLANITDAGTGYSVDDTGVVVVGGFAFHYVIMNTGADGSVKDLKIIPSSDEYINLSNFDIMDNTTGITDSYGTSPLSGTGKGLHFRFCIKDYIKISPYKGDIFEGLHAFVKEHDGLWLYEYIIDKNSTTSPKYGKWNKSSLISRSDQTNSPLQSDGGISLSDAYINSIIPSLRNLPVNLYENGCDPTSLMVMSTPSFINIIDKNKSPICSSFGNSDYKTSQQVDLCKFYCDGVIRLRAGRKTESSVIDIIKSNKKVRHDSYIFWRWESKNDINNLYFTCGIIHRSFNNLLTTDSTTTLPVNDLTCKNYVNSNAGTTVVWDVNNVGVMMWTYNPTYQKHETYLIDQNTQELYVNKKNITWENIDIRDSKNGENISLIENGRLTYNILTNNIIQIKDIDSSLTSNSPIYQQPELCQLSDLTIGTLASEIIQEHQPMGNWQLVFPRINSFKLTNNADREFTPIRLQMIKGSNIGEISNVTDSYGKNINAKTVILDETTSGISMKMYNSETGNWEKI